MHFSELGLSAPLLRATDKLGYQTATPIQAQAIPSILEGSDLVGCAQTGTGKTAAFTLPMIDRLLASAPATQDNPNLAKQKPGKKGRRGRGGPPRVIRALVLSPTRELASQIGDSLQKYGQFTHLRHAVIYGGVSQFHQVKALRAGVDTVVATPGRLLDLKNQGHLDLSKVEVLVLDEADQMLDMGFLPDLKRIIGAVPQERQTLMFSATMPDEIRKLAQQWLTKPVSIEVARVSTPAEKITQSVHHVEKKQKPELLVRLLENTPHTRTLVFSRTKHGADKIVKRLGRAGFAAAAIHGNKSQGARDRALAQFKSNRPPVLVATDIAARGLDISGVSHVINFDLPQVAETYVHRIGRTARAGASGVAVSFCSIDERALLKQIEKLTKRAIAVEPTPEGFAPVKLPPPKGGRPKSAGAAAGGKPKRRRRPGAVKGQVKQGAGKPSAGKQGAGGQGQGKPATSAGPKKSRRRRRRGVGAA